MNKYCGTSIILPILQVECTKEGKISSSKLCDSRQLFNMNIGEYYLC